MIVLPVVILHRCLHGEPVCVPLVPGVEAVLPHHHDVTMICLLCLKITTRSLVLSSERFALIYNNTQELSVTFLSHTLHTLHMLLIGQAWRGGQRNKTIIGFINLNDIS